METNTDLIGLGRFLRERRRQLRLTQAQLAQQLSWTQERVSVLENGKYGLPSIPALAALARALDCSLTDLLRAAGFGDELLTSMNSSLVDGQGTREGQYHALQRLFGIEATSLGAVLKEAAGILAEVMSADSVDALVYDPGTASLVTLGSSNTPMAELQTEGSVMRLPTSSGAHEVEVFETGISYQSPHSEDDERPGHEVTDVLGVQSVIMVPLDMDGVRRGVLVAESSRRDHFVPTDLAFLETIAHWVGIIAHRTEAAAGAITRALEEVQPGTTANERVERNVNNQYVGPTVTELQRIVQRLQRELDATLPDRSALLHIEMTLRGMLPTLESMLQYVVAHIGPDGDVGVADRAIQALGQHLQWIQLHAHAPINVIKERVAASLACAEASLEQFAS